MNAQDLRNSILQLAILGKLVEQREEEGTAEELYRQIQEEKSKLIKEGKIKKEKPLPVIAEDEIPFEIPESWKWVYINDIAFVTKLAGFEYTKYLADEISPVGDIPIVRAQNIKPNRFIENENEFISMQLSERLNRSALNKRCVLMTFIGAGIGEVAIFENKKRYHLAPNVAKIVSHLDINDYVLFYLMSDAGRRQIFQYMKQTAQPSLSMETIRKGMIPLPPLEEQNRIVAKIEELMPYIEKYGEAHSKLKIFNKKFPEDMQKSILQYAIQGKLVEQREEEGTAEELYQKIQEEKAKLIKEGKIKKEKPLPEITEDEIPFEIPESWKWVRIPEMSHFQEGPGILAIDFRDFGIPLIRISGMQGDELSLEGCNYLDADMVERKWNHFKLDLGDIVISTSASMDKICEVTEKTVGSIPYTGQIRFKMYGNINKDYFKYFIKSSFYAKQINEQKSGGTIKHYGPTHLKKMIVPLPPLEEQKRIVAKIEEIMPYCQQLVK